MDDHKSTTSKPAISSPSQSTTPDPKAASSRPLYSSKLGDPKGRVPENSTSSPTTRQPPVPQKAWTTAKNPITGRSTTPQQNQYPAQNNQSVTGSLREGQRVRITLATGAEFEGIYASNPSDSSSCYLRMVQQKKLPGDITNGAGRQEQPSMSFQRKDITGARVVPGNPGKADTKTPNGSRTGFRTDAAISNSRAGSERALKPWVPDTAEELDGSLEKPSNHGAWDQFAANERLFGLKTDYDENIYTTTIDKNHPQYKERMAAAEKKAREIERSVPTTAHVAEERVMDFVGGEDHGDEEDKYSGVRRQDFPPLSNRENKYTPPARRAPTGQATVSGAPVDPAIISSQLRGAPPKKQPTPKPEDAKPPTPVSTKSPATPVAEKPAGEEAKAQSKGEAKAAEVKAGETGKPADAKPPEAKSGDKAATPLRPSAATSRTISPQVKEGNPAPSATSTVERDVLNSFKTFATQQRLNAEKVRSSKAKADKEVKLIELKKFADNFKLSTPVPSDLISIIAKDPAKQKQIQAKALQNAEDVAKQKAADAAAKEKEVVTKESQVKPPAEQPAAQPASAASDSRSSSRPTAPQHTSSPSGMPNRHPGARQPYAPQPYHQQQQYRNNRPPPHLSQQNQQTGNLAQRLRNVEQQKLAQPPQHAHMNQHIAPQDMRLPPTGPANNVDAGYGGRRLSGVPPAHIAAKLNPNSHEFRPNAFAPAFNPAGPSAGSSPRSSVNNVVETASNTPVVGQLIRRKTKAIDVKKCFILSHIQAIQPPQGKNWDDNDGLRPAFDTQPTWRQLQEEIEKPDSTMHLTYKEYFEKLPLTGAALATPNPPHVIPQIPHQHQLPFHLQHGAHNLGPRQSPHMPPMQMQAGQQGHAPHVPFNNPDDHRMMHSSSAQSFASPRMTQVPMAYPPGMNSPAQMPYNQAVMPQYMAPGAPQMGQYRSFSNNPQFIPQQPGHMGAPIMVQPQFMAAPNAMLATGPQVQMYPGHPQFIPPGPAPQPIAGSNGFPSPGRPAAPMMVPQGSQQGQPAMYGMSPGMQYQQPVFTPQQPGQMGNMRGYSNPGPQHFGTSPQQMHQYGPQHRNGSNSYGNKNFQAHGPGPQPGHSLPTGPQGRTPDGTEEAK